MSNITLAAPLDVKINVSFPSNSTALPSVSEADNDKVLTVVNGVWKPAVPKNAAYITVNGESPDEEGNFEINTLTNPEIAALSAALT